MIPLFALCLLQDTSALKGPRLVTGDPGGMVTIKCHYIPTPVNKHQRKYWCRLYPPQRVCHTIISTNFFINQSYQGRVTLLDFPSLGMFVVTLAQLAPEDTGYYRCGIGPRTDILFFSMNLTISTAQANHSLDSAILTIPSSIIPTTAQPARGQILETLGTSTSLIDRQELDTTLFIDEWQTRTIRRDTTPDEVTQTPGNIRTTNTVIGGQGLDTTLLAEGWGPRTSRRDTAPDEITQAPGTIGVTTVTGEQALDTTLLAEGWETRTSRRDTTPGEVTQAPGTIRTTTTVIGGQALDTTLLAEGWGTRTSRRDTTPGEATQAPGITGAIAPDLGGQVPKTMETTLVPGGQIFDTTLVIKGQGAGTRRGHITPTKSSETIRTITSVAARQGPGTLGGTTPAVGRQGLDTSLEAKGQEAGISRDLTLIRVTQLPAQASSKNTESLGTVRLWVPGTGDWALETTRAANLVPDGQTSGAKITADVTEGGLVLGTRATTKTIVGTIGEKSTVRSTNGLTEGIVGIRIPLITTTNSLGTIRPSTIVRESLKEVTPGTDQQTQGITRATAPDADVGDWFSLTIRKEKVSTLGGTASIGRESHSGEPLRRIQGAALVIPSSNKPFMENSSPDERHISQILITLSTVLLPFVLLVLLLLLRKLQKRISLRTQKPTFSPIQLTNFEDLPEKLSLEALPPQET